MSGLSMNAPDVQHHASRQDGVQGSLGSRGYYKYDGLMHHVGNIRLRDVRYEEVRIARLWIIAMSECDGGVSSTVRTGAARLQMIFPADVAERLGVSVSCGDNSRRRCSYL